MLEKYFSYYNGEDKCPFPLGSVNWGFWHYEQQMACSKTRNRGKAETSKWEKMLLDLADEYAKKFSKKKERGEELTPLQVRFLSYSDGKRALAVRLGLRLQTFDPYNCDRLLLKY